MRFGTKAGSLAAALLPLLLAGGCTGSEVLDTGNTAFEIEVVISNPDTRFNQFSTMSITQINIRPNDPAADAALGQFPIGALATTEDIIDIDFSDPEITDATSIVLSSGSYRINKLQFANLLLVQNPRPPTWPTCPDFTPWFFPQTIFEFNAAQLGDEGSFNVPAGGIGKLTFQIDAEAFIAAYTNSWNCVSTPSGPVPVTLKADEFRALAPTYLSIEFSSN